ncbi:MAG: hypothetical protein EAX95_13280 [Candidatus Thorarchaeota archaeon]|nr:hypothetical protein [Candidatus Thorarchaeota archaeon]
MTLVTLVLVSNELKMQFNQFKRTIRTPSMLMFYGITLFGVYFVSLVISSLLSFGPVILTMGAVLGDAIERGMIFTAIGLLSVSSVVGGYFGVGAANLMTTSDEHILMTGPVKPYQLILGRYTKRILRKIVFTFVGLLALSPLIISANAYVVPLSIMLISLVVFFETNYFLGAIASYLHVKVRHRTRGKLEYLPLLAMALAVFIPTIPEFVDTNPHLMFIPSNATSVIVTELTGLFSVGLGPAFGYFFLAIGFLICFLFLAALSDYDYYEIFATAYGQDQAESRFSRIIHGQVDFSHTRFNDPMMWIVLKDFWSRMRSPMQIWKYVYIGFGTVLVVFLNITNPEFLPPLEIPPSLAATAVPAFLLLLLLMVQMSSVTSLLSFVDEEENIYLLKASPFRATDIVLSKYLLSVLEVGLASIPLIGFLVYFFRVPGYLALVSLAAPLVLIFSAVGVAIGAYVPVFTNEPEVLPVPLAFSFPVLNLSMGSMLIILIAIFAEDTMLMTILPIFVVVLVAFFLRAAVKAMSSFR